VSTRTMPNSTIPPISAHTPVLRSGVDQIKHTTVLWLTVCVGIMASSRFLSFSDPFPYQAAIRATDVELYPTTRGRFQSELTQVSFDRLWMQRFNERLPQVYASTVRPGRRVIGFLSDADQPSIQNCGRECSPQEIVVNGYDVMHHTTAAHCRFGAMSLTTDDFDATCKAVVGHGSFGRNSGIRGLAGSV
jgi:hypothetical protein